MKKNEKPKGFTEADGTFEGEKVKTLNYGSEIVLYALWNHWTGDVILRTYDPATQTFGEPASFKQGNNTYYLLKIPSGTEIPEGYTKTELTLNGNKVEALLYDSERLAQMGEAAKTLGMPDAADQIAKIILDMERT